MSIHTQPSGTLSSVGCGIASKGTSQQKNLAKRFVTAAFALVLFIVLAASITYPVGNPIAMDLAYIAFPFLLFTIFLAVYVYSYIHLKDGWKNTKLKLLSVVAGVGYAVFYVFSTNIVSTPDSGSYSSSVPAFFISSQVYGQLTVWPDVEFWSPTWNLAGYFSVGNILLVSSLAMLTTFSVTLLTQNIRVKRNLRGQNIASFAGAFASSLSTNACCCCYPVVLPALLALFGIASTNPLAEGFVYQISPLFNLIWIANLSFFLASVLLSVRKLDACSRSPVYR